MTRRQLVINTATTVLTFLMVFLIQNTQNRDSMALQLKLDELIKAVQGTNEQLIDIEESSEDELESFKDDYRKLAHDRHSNIPRPVEATGGKGNAAV